MIRMIGACGIVCTDCGAYRATQADDDEIRAAIAEQWSREYGRQFAVADINCDGCRSTTDVLFGYCRECEVRACADGKRLPNCAHCNDYACDRLNQFFVHVPAAREVLDGIREGLGAT
jgi:hypothetical protein